MREIEASAVPSIRVTPTVALVVNPSKVQHLEHLKQQVAATLHEAGWCEPVWYTTTTLDAGFGQTTEAMRKGATVVVACGGDGTIRECVSALKGTDVALGIVPAGTGNLLARALGIPLDLASAVNVVTSGYHRRIDVADVDGKSCLVMAGMGFDAALVGDASESLKAHIGVAAYAWTALRRLLERPMLVRISLDGKAPLRRAARSVLVGKVGQLPGGIQLMKVEADDGQLAVAIITANSIGQWLRILWAVLTRRKRVPRIETYHAKSVHIEARTVQRRQVDGDEIARGKTMTIHVVPKALSVCTPR